MQDNDEEARIKLVMKQMRHDIVVLLRSGQDATSRIRFLQTKDLVPEGFVLKNLIHLELQTNYTETDLMGLAAFFKGCLNLQTLIVDHDATGQDETLSQKLQWKEIWYCLPSLKKLSFKNSR